MSENDSICENEDNVSEYNPFIDNQIKSNLSDNNYIITNNDKNRNTQLKLNNLNIVNNSKTLIKDLDKDEKQIFINFYNNDLDYSFEEKDIVSNDLHKFNKNI